MQSIFAVLVILFATNSFAVSSSALDVKPGSVWILKKEIRLLRKPMIPGNPAGYSVIWDLKTGAFLSSGTAMNDSCEFSREYSSEMAQNSSFELKSGTSLSISDYHESLDKIIIQLSRSNQKTPVLEVFTLDCRAYVKGTAGKNLAADYKTQMLQSLGQLFRPPVD